MSNDAKLEEVRAFISKASKRLYDLGTLENEVKQLVKDSEKRADSNSKKISELRESVNSEFKELSSELREIRLAVNKLLERIEGLESDKERIDRLEEKNKIISQLEKSIDSLRLEIRESDVSDELRKISSDLKALKKDMEAVTGFVESDNVVSKQDLKEGLKEISKEAGEKLSGTRKIIDTKINADLKQELEPFESEIKLLRRELEIIKKENLKLNEALAAFKKRPVVIKEEEIEEEKEAFSVIRALKSVFKEAEEEKEVRKEVEEKEEEAERIPLPGAPQKIPLWLVIVGIIIIIGIGFLYFNKQLIPESLIQNLWALVLRYKYYLLGAIAVIITIYLLTRTEEGEEKEGEEEAVDLEEFFRGTAEAKETKKPVKEKVGFLKKVSGFFAEEEAEQPEKKEKKKRKKEKKTKKKKGFLDFFFEEE